MKKDKNKEDWAKAKERLRLYYIVAGQISHVLTFLCTIRIGEISWVEKFIKIIFEASCFTSKLKLNQYKTFEFLKRTNIFVQSCIHDVMNQK